MTDHKSWNLWLSLLVVFTTIVGVLSLFLLVFGANPKETFDVSWVRGLAASLLTAIAAQVGRALVGVDGIAETRMQKVLGFTLVATGVVVVTLVAMVAILGFVALVASGDVLNALLVLGLFVAFMWASTAPPNKMFEQFLVTMVVVPYSVVLLLYWLVRLFLWSARVLATGA